MTAVCFVRAKHLVASLLLVLTAMVATTLAEKPQTTTLIVKMAKGLSQAQQRAAIGRHGSSPKASVPQLDVQIVEVPAPAAEAVTRAFITDRDVKRVELSNVRKWQGYPTDSLIGNQWSLPKIGWDHVYGNVVPGTLTSVAILDTGVDASHPDLVGTLAPGTSIIDGSNGLTDLNGHGTWLAGIVAASTNNLEGIAGVGYAQVQVMPVKVLDADGYGQDSDIIAGLVWAADHGASVILMAFSNPGFSESLQDAIDYAWSRGAVLVAAAGNDSSSAATFPAGDRGVIGVSATDQNDDIAPTSNYGPSVFLAAPGVDILGTYKEHGYISWSGTSASAAIVAGVAALVRSVDPTLMNGVVVGRIARTADAAGTQEQTGNGRVNLARALTDTSTDEIQPVGSAPLGGGGPFVGPYKIAGNSSVSGFVRSSAAGNPPIAGATVQCITTGTNPCNNATSTTTLADGSYSLTIQFAGGSGTIQLTASAAGFASAFNDIAVANGSNPSNQNFILSGSKLTPTITFDAPPTPSFMGGNFSVHATTTNTDSSTVVYSYVSGPCAFVSGSTFSSTGAGSCIVSASGAETANFLAASGQQTIIISKATPSLTWSNPGDITYPAALGATQLNATASVAGGFVYTPPSGTVLNAGNGQTLHVDFTPTDSTNYSNASNDVAINVLKATPSITWSNPGDITYPAALGATQLNATASVAGGFVYTPPSGTVLNAGNGQTLHVDFTPTDTTNYNNASKDVAITVLKATLSITWSNPGDITYPAALGATQLNATASVAGGFVYTPPSGTVLDAGNGQTLHVDFTPTDTTNYNNASKDVAINVQKGTPIITWSNPGDITYPAALGATQLNATASVAGGLVYTPPSGTVLNAGNGQTLHVDFTPTDTTNYNNASKDVTINVLKATPSITWSNPADITYPAALGATQLNATASVAGGFVYTPPSGTVLNAGNGQTLHVDFTPTDTTNYNNATKDVAINVLKATPSITWSNPGDITYPAALGATQLNATASVAGGFVYTPPSGTVLNAGNGQTLHVDFTPTDTTNYNNASKNVTINVLKTTQTINWSNPADIIYGAALGATQLNASVTVPGPSPAGALTYAPTAGTILDSGLSQALQVNAAETTNYDAATKTVYINVQKADQTINWSNPTNITYPTALSNVQLNATVSVPGPSPAGALTYTPAAGAILNAGPAQALQVAAAATSNYNAATKTVYITVLKADQTISWSNPANIMYGTALSSVQLNAIVTVPGASPAGAITYTPSAGTYLLAGPNQPLKVDVAGTSNYNPATKTVYITVDPRPGLTSYIGQTVFVTSGSSSTTAQVTLTASVQDPDGLGSIANATVNFKDLLTGKVLATGVKVALVSNTNTALGTANTIVTLSSGQYGAQEYLIEVSLGGSYQNTQQTQAAPGTTPYEAAHAMVTIMIPATKNTLLGVGPVAKLPTSAGIFGDGTVRSYTAGMVYNSKGTNPQGRIAFLIDSPDGSTYYIKSNSITSAAFSNPVGGVNKDVTVYTKANITRFKDGVATAIDGNVTLRFDAHDGGGSGDTVGLTVLSTKDSTLYYSNNWVWDAGTLSWKTVLQSVAGGTAVQIN